jgi:DNA-binding NarL/FixJ family response regulator
VDWQDELRMKMMDSARLSNARMRKMWGGSSWEQTVPSNKKEEPPKGPKPKPKKKKVEITKKAATVNKLLAKGWKVVDIADVLCVSHQAVSQIIKRYSLPREEDEYVVPNSSADDGDDS